MITPTASLSQTPEEVTKWHLKVKVKVVINEVFCPVVGNKAMHQFVTFRGCSVWGGLGSPWCWWQWMFGDTSWLIAIVICQLATITWNWPQSHQVTHSLIASVDPDVPHNPELRLWILKTEDALWISTKESGAWLMEPRVCPVHDGFWLFVCLGSKLLIASWCWLLCCSDDLVSSVLMFFFVFVFSYFAFILSQQSGSNHPSVREWVS